MPVPALLTKQELAALLRDVNVIKVAERAGVSAKTIYRLRNEDTDPSLDTVAAILRAVDEIRAEEEAKAN